MKFNEYINVRHFSSLDGIRAISILAVIWHHTASLHFPGVRLSELGYNGVALFFVISGFLITTLLLREKSRSRVNLKKFYIRRSLRIFPLYYAAILLYIIATLFVGGHNQYTLEFFNNLKYFLTYTNNIFVPHPLLDQRVIFYFAWSLAVEEQFYLVWPWIQKIQKNHFIILFLVVLIVFLVSLQQSEFLFQESTRQTILKILAIPIIFGALLAHLLNEKKAYDYLQKLFKYRYSSLTLFSLFIALLYFKSVDDALPFFVMALFVGACVTNPEHIMAPILNNKFIIHIGKISYGMYLIHMLCYNVVKLGLIKLHINNNGIDAFILTSLLAIIAATISFNTYEKYFLNLKKKYT